MKVQDSTSNNIPSAAVREKTPVPRIRKLTIVLLVLLLAGTVELLIARGVWAPGAHDGVNRLDTSLLEPSRVALSSDDQQRVLLRRSAAAAVFASALGERIAGRLNGRAIVPPFEITAGKEPAEPATLAGAVTAGLRAAALRDLLQWNALCDASSKEPAVSLYLTLVQQVKTGDVWIADYVLFFEGAAFVRIYQESEPARPVIMRLRQEGALWLYTFTFHDEEAANVIAAALARGAIAKL